MLVPISCQFRANFDCEVSSFRAVSNRPLVTGMVNERRANAAIATNGLRL